MIGGQTQFNFIDFITELPHIKSGRLRALAGANKRTPLLPGRPALSDALPGFALTSWNGVLAPAGTPKELINRLNGDPRAVLAGRGGPELPTTDRLLDLFRDLQRHDLYAGQRRMQVFHPQLSDLQTQVLGLLGVPDSAYGVGR